MDTLEGTDAVPLPPRARKWKESLSQMTGRAEEKIRNSEFAQAAIAHTATAFERTSSTMERAKAAGVSEAARLFGGGDTVVVLFEEAGPLGVSFGSIGDSADEAGGPKVVIGLDEDGLAATRYSGAVKIGMVLTAVQDVPCGQLSFTASLDLIRHATRPLKLAFRQPNRRDKMEWVESTDWDAAIDMSHDGTAAVGAGVAPSQTGTEVVIGNAVSADAPGRLPPPPQLPPPPPAPEAAPGAGSALEAAAVAPPLNPAVGLAVRVRPAGVAEAACVAAGVKWNRARERQSSSRSIGTIDSIDAKTADDPDRQMLVRVRWEINLPGRIDTVNLNFPVAALESNFQAPGCGAPPPQVLADAGLESLQAGETEPAPQTAAPSAETLAPRGGYPDELPTQLPDDQAEITAEVVVAQTPAAAAAAATTTSGDASIDVITEILTQAEAALALGTSEQCEHAALLFADALEQSPHSVAAKSGLRRALQACRALR